MADLLSLELKTYTDEFEKFLGSNEGKYVVIHDNNVLGFFDNQMDAIAFGYRNLGNVPFLVKQILRVETPLNFVSNHLGI